MAREGKTNKTNPVLTRTIDELKRLGREREAPVWRDLARRLEGAKRTWAEVNLSRVERYAAAQEVVAIPGKLLGSGSITKPVTVGAFKSSAAARRKVEAAGGRVLSLLELAAQHPDGSGVRLMG